MGSIERSVYQETQEDETQSGPVSGVGSILSGFGEAPAPGTQDLIPKKQGTEHAVHWRKVVSHKVNASSNNDQLQRGWVKLLKEENLSTRFMRMPAGHSIQEIFAKAMVKDFYGIQEVPGNVRAYMMTEVFATNASLPADCDLHILREVNTQSYIGNVSVKEI